MLNRFHHYITLPLSLMLTKLFNHLGCYTLMANIAAFGLRTRHRVREEHHNFGFAVHVLEVAADLGVFRVLPSLHPKNWYNPLNGTEAESMRVLKTPAAR